LRSPSSSSSDDKTICADFPVAVKPQRPRSSPPRRSEQALTHYLKRYKGAVSFLLIDLVALLLAAWRGGRRSDQNVLCSKIANSSENRRAFCRPRWTLIAIEWTRPLPPHPLPLREVNARSTSRSRYPGAPQACRIHDAHGDAHADSEHYQLSH